MMASKKRSHSSKKQPKEEKTVSQACNMFAWDLYQTLIKKEDPGDNLILSPWSIKTVLDMVLLGAQNNTKVQMVDVLHVEQFPSDYLHKTMSQSLRTLTIGDDDYILRIANRLYAQQGFKLLKKYLKASKKYYEAEVKCVNFANGAAARQEINTWVAEQTADKIKDLIPPGLLTEATRLVLVNAIYFKGDWLNKFNKDNTKDGDFYTDSSNKVTVEMMYHERKFRCGYNSSLKAKALELPYKGEDLSMIVLLPDGKDGLAELEDKLTSDHLNSLNRSFSMYTKKTKVSLPKFKLEGSFNLKQILSRLGMNDLFNGTKADLSGIDGTKSLVVSEVVHKAFINVDEEGSEAAAATGGIMMLTSMPPSTIEEFKADHPFLFMIKENATESILFLGRMVEPPRSETGRRIEPSQRESYRSVDPSEAETSKTVNEQPGSKGPSFGAISPNVSSSKSAQISVSGDNVTRIKITCPPPLATKQ